MSFMHPGGSSVTASFRISPEAGLLSIQSESRYDIIKTPDIPRICSAYPETVMVQHLHIQTMHTKGKDV
ncbi:MAG TPA: hypothetical protein DCF42_07270 [Lachnospiraceae bacterium]|nr:hypothetical protein [Lachnospiraceae bacterium]